MRFTVHFTLGSVLLLLSCWSLETTQLENVDSKSSEKTEKILENNEIKNLTKENNKIQKTEISNGDKESGIKLKKSEPYKKTSEEVVNNVSNNKSKQRDEIGRSFDVEKYYSNDFHNKNNIYNLSISKDTEKYINPDYEYHVSSTQKDFDFHVASTSEKSSFDESNDSIELTTPKSLLFDNKYQETVDSVEQKLEHIDDSHEADSLESTSKEINLEKLLNATRTDDAKANLDYVKYKSLLSNDTEIKNSIHKDHIVESGTKLNFQSAFNNTQIIDDEVGEDGNNTIIKEQTEKIEITTVKSIPLTTPKRIILLKPKPTRNPILSNKIEQDAAVKAINSENITENPKGQPEVVLETNTKRAPIDITKRGSVKFADYAKMPTTLRPRSTTVSVRNEELLQENQIVPISVEAPKNMDKNKTFVESTTISSTTTESLTITTDITEKTVTSTTITVPETTTQFIEKTTTNNPFTTVETDYLSTTQQPETTTTTDSDFLSTIPTVVDVSDGLTTTDTIPTTEIEEITTEESSTVDDSIAKTTENSSRTSKGFIFDSSDLTTTTEAISTTEIPTSTENYNEMTTETATEVSINEETTTLPPSTTPAIIEETTIVLKEFNEDKATTPQESTESELVLLTHTIDTLEVQTTSLPNLLKDNRNINVTVEEEVTTTENTTQIDPNELNSSGDNSGTIAAITISSIGAVCLILLAGLLIIMRKRQKRFNYGQRCTPVSLDDYSMDNVSVYNSVRRKVISRSSKRSYGNPAFEDPATVSHPLNFPALGKFANNLEEMKAEFDEIPQITARTNELPEGCDTKNRYANVIPLPETRVFLTPIDGYPNSDYINANYVTGPKNTKGYYIACQAPMQSTVDDFWRMIWEQQCKVVLMLTHHFENGVEKCADYLPPSEVLDCHRLFGDFQVTLKKREVKDKYIISILQLKNMVSNSWREVTHFWYMGWPEKGVPTEANSLIAFLIEARSYMKSSSIDRKEVTNGNVTNGAKKTEINPVVVHCSPGTGRTGVVIACDIAIREFEQTRLIDLPKIVYKIRRDRASSVQTKEQYIFIYKVINLYASKLTGCALDSI